MSYQIIKNYKKTKEITGFKVVREHSRIIYSDVNETKTQYFSLYIKKYVQDEKEFNEESY